MKAAWSLIILIFFGIYFLSDCRAFESKTFLELGKIKKVSTEIHTYKEELSKETITMHDKVADELRGLIDAIIDEIQSEEKCPSGERVHDKLFLI